jgi:hypothetical protein
MLDGVGKDKAQALRQVHNKELHVRHFVRDNLRDEQLPLKA